MTNEQYLYASYFVAVGAGVALAAATALWLHRPHARAAAGASVRRLGALLGRVFPLWLVLAVLLAFVSVSYFDCGHGTYAEIVADREHLIATSQTHASRMLYCLAGTLMGYAVMLTICLGVLQGGGGGRRGQGVR